MHWISILFIVVPIFFAVLEKWTYYKVAITIECLILLVAEIYFKLYSRAAIVAIVWAIALLVVNVCEKQKNR